MQLLRKKRSEESIDAAINSQQKAYATAASLSRAVSKAKNALPKRPRKKCAVIKRLSNQFKPLCENNVKVISSHNALSKELKDNVSKFYCRDDISRQAPGKKNVIKMTNNETNSTIKVQKHHLYTTVNEVHQVFKKENPTIKIGKSSFANLRPKNVLLMAETPTKVCVCQIHANFNYLIESLCNISPYQKPKNIISQLVCNLQNEICMMNNCNKCSITEERLLKILKISDEIDLQDYDVSWNEWCQNEEKRLVKFKNEGTADEVIKKIMDRQPAYMAHTFIKEEQHEFFNTLQKTDKNNCILMQIDFAENFTISYQDEIQSAHWAKN